MFDKNCIHCENMIDCKNPIGKGCINFKGELTKEVNNNTIIIDVNKFMENKDDKGRSV